MTFPVFPLNGAILFPGTNLPLNIFEERYLQMVDYALSKDRMVGMIQKKENGDLFKIGCLGRITSFTEAEDGKYQINLQGVNRFCFKKIIPNDYKFITIDADIVKTQNSFKSMTVTNEKLLFKFKKFLKMKNIFFNTSEFENLETSNLAKIICVISPLDNLIKQMLLELDSDEDLCKNLITVLDMEMQSSETGLSLN